MNIKGRTLRRADKIYLIYCELISQLGNTTPRVELLRIAHKLVDLPSKDRKKEINLLTKPVGRENYYARDVFKMVETSPWLTLSREYRTINEFN